MTESNLKVSEADRLSERVLILFNKTDIERLNKYCDAKSKNAARYRGHVLRTMIMLKVGAWEKRNRQA